MIWLKFRVFKNTRSKSKVTAGAMSIRNLKLWIQGEPACNPGISVMCCWSMAGLVNHIMRDLVRATQIWARLGMTGKAARACQILIAKKRSRDPLFTKNLGMAWNLVKMCTRASMRESRLLDQPKKHFQLENESTKPRNGAKIRHQTWTNWAKTYRHQHPARGHKRHRKAAHKIGVLESQKNEDL